MNPEKYGCRDRVVKNQRRMKNTCRPEIRPPPKSLPETFLSDSTPAEHRSSAFRGHKGVAMKTSKQMPLAQAAILTLAEIKTVVEAFDRGDANALHALDTIVVAVEAYIAAAKPQPKAA